MRKYAAEFLGTFWLVMGGCGSAVLAAAFPELGIGFHGVALAFGLTTLISESKTARTIVMFPIIIAVAKRFGWDVIGFSLPMAFLINQVYVLYFNSKPANISYLTNQYSSWESLKFGILQMLACIVMLILWTQYVMPLMGFDSRLW